MQGIQVFVTRIANARRVRFGFSALGIGALSALGQAPIGTWPVSLAAFAIVLGLYSGCATWRRAGFLGWAVGTGYFALSLNWIVEPFFVDAARHGWMAPFAIIFMSGGLALFWAVAFALVRRAQGGLIALIAAMTLSEAARGRVLTGFPWAQPGHIWIDTPVLQLAAYLGPLGLCALTFVAAALLWRGLTGRLWSLGAAIMLVGGVFVWLTPLSAPQAVPSDAPVVRLVQPNAAQHQKWDPAMIPVFFQRKMTYTSAAPRPDLVVWPETAIPVLLNNAGPTLSEISRASTGVPVVLGVQRFEGVRLYNSLVQLDEDGQVAALYDKHHLVPFGEYIPFGRHLKRFGLRGLAAEDGDGYSAGPGARIIDIPGIGKALPLICYEGVFPQDVAAAPERPDVLLLITNDAWFGKFSGPYQHFAQARLRSVEQGLPMIRAANTGISAIIDARGHVNEWVPLGQAGYLDAPLPPPLPPTLYARTGDWPFVVLLTLLGGAFITRRFRAPLSD